MSKGKKKKYYIDFSNYDFFTDKGGVFLVDIATDERLDIHVSGALNTRSKVNAFLMGFKEAKEEYRRNHPGIYLEGDDDEEIMKFGDKIFDFNMVISRIDSFITSCLLTPIIYDNSSIKEMNKIKRKILSKITKLFLTKDTFNDLYLLLSNLSDSKRRDKQKCIKMVNENLCNLKKSFENSKPLYNEVKREVANDANSNIETFKLLITCISEFSEISRIINKCTDCLSILLSEQFIVLSADLLEPIFQEYNIKGK